MPRLVPVHWKRLERVLQSAGYEFLRQEGSHRVYARPGSIRPVVIPAYHEVPVAVIKSNLRTAGISREEYFRLMEIV
ncbi:MAG: type II toxin-antitoxin system HicA family toxin [Bryobacter sp.]|nr:type II toxin-antitoxin system HicA family toxin [Bryobacter sp.]